MMKTKSLLISTLFAAAVGLSFAVPANAEEVTLSTTTTQITTLSASMGEGNTYISSGDSDYVIDSVLWLGPAWASNTTGGFTGTVTGTGTLEMYMNGGNGGTTYNLTLSGADFSGFTGQLTVVNNWNMPLNIYVSGEANFSNVEFIFGTVTREKDWPNNIGEGAVGNHTLILSDSTTFAGITGTSKDYTDATFDDLHVKEYLTASSSGTVLTLAGTGTYAYYGALGTSSVAISLDKTGTGTQTFGGTNYLQDVSVSAGTLALDGTTLVSGNISVEQAGTLDLSGGAIVFKKPIENSGTVVVDESTEILTIIASDGVIVAGGTVPGTITADSLNLRDTVTIRAANGLVVSGDGFAKDLTWAYTNGNWNAGTTNGAENWTIDGEADNVKFYFGDNVTFSGTNTGTITLQQNISAGTITVAADSATTFATATYTLLANVLNVSSNLTVSGTGSSWVNTLNATGGTTTFSNMGSLSFGNVTITGSSTVVSTTNSALDGFWDIQEGYFRLGNTGTSSSGINIDSSATVLVSSGARMVWNIGGGSTTNTKYYNGGDIYLKSGAELRNIDGHLVIGEDTHIYFNVSDDYDGTGTPTYNADGVSNFTQYWQKTIQIDGIISGDGTVNLKAPEVEANAYYRITGTQNDFSGTYSLWNNNSHNTYLVLLSETAAQYATVKIVTRTTLRIGAERTIVAGIYSDSDWPGEIDMTSDLSAATLVVNQSTDLAYYGSIASGITLEKEGAGTLTLAGTNSQSATIVNAGTLKISGDNTALSNVEVNDGTLQISNSPTITGFTLNGGDLVVDSGATLTLAGTLIFNSVLPETGDGTLSIDSAATVEISQDLISSKSGFTQTYKVSDTSILAGISVDNISVAGISTGTLSVNSDGGSVTIDYGVTADYSYTASSSNVGTGNATMNADSGTSIAVTASAIDLSLFAGKTVEFSGGGTTITNVSTNGGSGGRITFSTYSGTDEVRIILNGGTEANIGNIYTNDKITLYLDDASVFGGTDPYALNLVIGDGGVRWNGGSSNTYTYTGTITGTGTYCYVTAASNSGSKNIILGDTSGFSGRWSRVSTMTSHRPFEFGDGSIAAPNGVVGGDLGSPGLVEYVTYKFTGNYEVNGEIYAGTLTVANGNATFTGKIAPVSAVTVSSGATLILTADTLLSLESKGENALAVGTYTLIDSSSAGTIMGWENITVDNLVGAARNTVFSIDSTNVGVVEVLEINEGGNLTWNTGNGNWDRFTKNWTNDDTGKIDHFYLLDSVTFATSGASVTIMDDIHAVKVNVDENLALTPGSHTVVFDELKIADGKTLELTNSQSSSPTTSFGSIELGAGSVLQVTTTVTMSNAISLGNVKLDGDATIQGYAGNHGIVVSATGLEGSGTLTFIGNHKSSAGAFLFLEGDSTEGAFTGTINVQQNQDGSRPVGVQISNEFIMENATLQYGVRQTNGSVLLLAIDNETVKLGGLVNTFDTLTVFSGTITPMGGSSNTHSTTDADSKYTLEFTGSETYSSVGTFKNLNFVHSGTGTQTIAGTVTGNESIEVSAGTLAFTGAVSGTKDITVSAGTLTFGSTLTIDADNAQTITIGETGSLELTTTNAANFTDVTIESAGTLTVAGTISAGTVSVTGGTTTLSGAVSNLASVSVGESATLTANNSSNGTFDSVAIESAGTLDLAGTISAGTVSVTAGTTTLTGTDSTLTSATITAGTLSFDGASITTLDSAGTATVSNTAATITTASITAGMFEFAGTQIGTLTSAGTTNVSNENATITEATISAGTFTFAGTQIGTLSTAGTTTVSNTAATLGATTVSAGTLNLTGTTVEITGDLTIGDGAAVSNSGTLTLSGTTLTLGEMITGTGTITIANADDFVIHFAEDLGVESGDFTTYDISTTGTVTIPTGALSASNVYIGNALVADMRATISGATVSVLTGSIIWNGAEGATWSKAATDDNWLLGINSTRFYDKDSVKFADGNTNSATLGAAVVTKNLTVEGDTSISIGEANYSITVDGVTTIAAGKSLTLNYTADADYAKSSLNINGTGTVNVTASALTGTNAVALDLGANFTGTLDWTGNYKVDAVTLGGATALTLRDSTIWTSEAAATIAVATTIATDSTVAAGTNLTFSNDLTIDAGATLTLGNGAAVSAAGTLAGTIAADTDASATLAITGTIASGTELTLSGTGLSATLDTMNANSGTLTVDGANLTVTQNQNYGTLVLTNGAVVERTEHTAGGAGFTLGTIESVSADSKIIFASQQNRWQLDLGSAFAGTLELRTSSSSAVDFSLNANTNTTGTKFVLASENVNLLTNSATTFSGISVSGAGTFKINGASNPTITFNGDNTIDSAFETLIASDNSSGTSASNSGMLKIASGTTTINSSLVAEKFLTAVEIESGAALILTADENSLAGTLTVAGTLTANDLTGTTISATGTITAGTLTADSLTATGATITLTGALEATTSATFTGTTLTADSVSATTISLDAGTATIAGAIAAGTLTLANDATVSAESVTVTGALEVAGTLTAGTTISANGITLTNGTISADESITSTDAVSVAGTLSTGTLDVGTNALTLTDGAISADSITAGTTLVSAGTVDADTISVDSLTSSGTITATSLSANVATINAGTLEADSISVGTLTSAGTVSAATLTLTGTLNVTAGTLTATDSLTLGGNATIATGATVSTGTLTAAGTDATNLLTIANDGTLEFTSAELTFVSATNLTVAADATATITDSTISGLTSAAGSTIELAGATTLAGTNTLAGTLIIDNSPTATPITLAAGSATTIEASTLVLDLTTFDVEAAKTATQTYTVFAVDSSATLTGWSDLDQANLYVKSGEVYVAVSDLHNVVDFTTGAAGTFTFTVQSLALTWNGGVAGEWIDDGEGWLNANNEASKFYQLDSVIFGAGTDNTVSLVGAKSVNTMTINADTTFENLGANETSINVVSTAGTSNVTIADSATLTLKVVGTGAVLTNAAIEGGTLEVNTETSIAWSTAFADTTLTGTALEKSGTGTLTIDEGTFGATKIEVNSGTLKVLAAADISSVHEVNVALAATFAVEISSTSGTTVALDNVRGLGTLQKLGDGNLDLTGTLALSGGLEILEGSVTLKSASAAGTGTTTVGEDGALIFDISSGKTEVAAEIVGTGTIEKVDNNELTLSGDHSEFAGTVKVSAGTLIATNDTIVPAAATAEIESGATLQLAFEEGGEYAATTLGAGTLAVAGAKDWVVLSGDASAFTGTVSVNSGKARATSSAALGAGTVSLAKGATLELFVAEGSQTFAQQFAVAAESTLRKTGAGEAVLTNSANVIGTQKLSVVGGTLKSQGVAALGGVSVVEVSAGAVLNIAVSSTPATVSLGFSAISDLPTATDTLANTKVVGDGELVISGGGVLEIKSNIDATLVTVESGTSIITESMDNVGTGTVTVESGATWYVNDHALVVSEADPDLPSTIVVEETGKIVIGSATFAGTASSAMTISNISISEKSAGTILLAFAVESTEDLTTECIVGGAISGVSNLEIEVEVADGVTIADGVVQVISKGSIAQSVVDNAVVTVIGQDGKFQIVEDGNGNYVISSNAIVDSFNLGYSSMIAMSRDVFGQDVLAIHNRLEQRRFETNELGNIEFFAQMQASSVDNGNNVSKSGRFDYNTYGALVGGDRRIAWGTTVGLALGYDHGKADIHGSQGKIEMDNYRLTAFASQILGDYAYIEGGVSAGTASYEIKRSGSNSKESVDGYNVGAFARVGAVVPVMDNLALLPYVGVSALYSTHDSFSDGLYDVDSGDATSLQGRVGASLRYDFTFASAYKTALTFDIAYVHEFADDELTTDAKTAKSSFSRDEVIADDDYLTLGVEASMSIGLGASAFIGYSADIGEDTTHHAHVGLRYKF